MAKRPWLSIGLSVLERLRDDKIDHPCQLQGKFKVDHPSLDWLQEQYPGQLWVWKPREHDAYNVISFEGHCPKPKESQPLEEFMQWAMSTASNP